MNFEKDDVWGTRGRRSLASTRPETAVPYGCGSPSATPMTSTQFGQAPAGAGVGDAFGPEAVVRARAMDYELTTRIQQESPYVAEQVVEHKVHDYRLYMGMWIVAGISGVTAFLTFDLMHLAITAVAVVFALISSPGRQRYED